MPNSTPKESTVVPPQPRYRWCRLWQGGRGGVDLFQILMSDFPDLPLYRGLPPVPIPTKAAAGPMW